MSKPDSLGQLVAHYLAEQCTAILDGDGPLRDGENVVHATRVSVRRLRSTLRVFDDLFDVPQAAHLEDDLVWWAGLLGTVRDLDILTARLSAQLAELPPEWVLGPVESTIDSELAGQRHHAMSEVRAAMDSDRYRALLADVHRWRSDPPMTAEAKRPASRVTHYVKRAQRKLDKRLSAAVTARRSGEGAHDLFHRARKSGKRHRYAVELALPVLGGKAQRLVADRKALQDVLGDQQDSRVAAAFLRDLGARKGLVSGQNGFTYGHLHARETAADAGLLDRLKPFL